MAMSPCTPQGPLANACFANLWIDCGGTHNRVGRRHSPVCPKFRRPARDDYVSSKG